MYKPNLEIIKNLLGKDYSNESFYYAIDKSKNLKSLNLEESATVLTKSLKSKEYRDLLINSSRDITNKVFGEKVSIFVPLYISNYCRNTCPYCVDRADNREQKRVRLNDEQFIAEIQELTRRGFTGIEIVAATDPKMKGEDYAHKIDLAKQNNVRSIMANIDSMNQEDYKKLKEAGLDVYILFQETYHPETYQRLHNPKTHKGDMKYRLSAHDRAAKAGINHFGLGALLGLFDYKYELLSLIDHANYLKDRYRITTSFSIPRIQKSECAPASQNLEYKVKDNEMELIASVLRVSHPTSGIAISTRENREMRKRLLSIGGTSTSAESSTSVGGYANSYQDLGQFPTHFVSINETLEDILSIGKIPNFCTACSQSDTFGEIFEKIASRGELKQICQLNTILSFAEYIKNYAQNKTSLLNYLNRYTESLGISEDSRLEILNALNEIKQGKKNIFINPQTRKL